MKNGSCPSGVNAASCSHSTRTGPKKLSRSTPPSRSFATTNDCSPGGWAEKLEESRVMPMIMRDSPQTQKPETAEFRFMDRLGAGAVNVRRKRVLDPIRKRSAVFGVIAAVDHERMVFRAPHNRLAARERTVNELDHLIELHIHHPRLGTRVRVVRRAPTLDAVARKVEFDPALFAEHGAGQLGRAQRVAVETGGRAALRGHMHISPFSLPCPESPSARHARRFAHPRRRRNRGGGLRVRRWPCCR